MELNKYSPEKLITLLAAVKTVSSMINDPQRKAELIEWHNDIEQALSDSMFEKAYNNLPFPKD